MTRIRLLYVLLVGLALLSGCGVAQLPWASDEKVARAAYVSPERPSVTLITVVTNKGRYGGHSALLINGSQRVLYDPAGSWFQEVLAERADLIYGMSPRAFDNYLSYHARKKYHVVQQKKFIPLSVANRLIANAKAQGASQNGFCAVNTGHILAGTAGFAGAPAGFSPIKLMDWMAAQPGVSEDKFYEDDEDQAVERL